MTQDHRRARRVSELLRAHLTEFMTREIGDARLSRVVVTGVEMGDDLGLAKVGVRLLGDDSPAERKAALSALGKASTRLRRAVGGRLGLRRVPELRFSFDEGPDAAGRVAELLREIEKEREPKP
jgi:ribosome-binding factor A